MNWIAGKDSRGSVPRLIDGHPVFWVSECGRFTLCRVMTYRGVMYDAWRRDPREQLVGGVSREEAIAACV